MKKRMNVYLTTAKKVYKYAYPVIESLYEMNSDSQIYLYIVSEDLEYSDLESEIAIARQYDGQLKILRFNVDMAKKYIKTAESDHWPLGTLGCYWLFHELLPDDVDRIMAIESDAIVVGSLREFYDTNLEGYYAACPDAEHKPIAHQELMKQIDGDLLTFVPSVYDVEAIRRDFAIDQILETDKKSVSALGHSQQELTFGCLFKNHIKFLPAKEICVEENSASLKRFGLKYLVESEKTEKLIHFSSTSEKEKPWNPVFIMPGYEKWWKYACESPYYEWYIENQMKWQENQISKRTQTEKNISKKNIYICTILIWFILLFLISFAKGKCDMIEMCTISLSLLIAYVLTLAIRQVSILWNKR